MIINALDWFTQADIKIDLNAMFEYFVTVFIGRMTNLCVRSSS